MTTMTFKVSHDDAARIRREARKHRAPVSAYIRSRLLPPAPAPQKRIYKKHPLTGLLVDVTPGPAITLETVREALADFP